MNDGKEREAPQYKALQAAYLENYESLKHQVKAIQTDPKLMEALEEHSARLGIEMSKLDLGSLVGEVCHDWPKIRSFINFALSLAVFWPGAGIMVAGAKAVVTMIDTQLMPGLCKAA